MLEEAEILETVEKLPIYDGFSGEKLSPKQIWEGTEGDLHFWATKSHVASHSGGYYLELRVEGKSEEEKNNLSPISLKPWENHLEKEKTQGGRMMILSVGVMLSLLLSKRRGIENDRLN